MGTFKICLDAGHSLTTSGKQSPDGVKEAQQNYAVMAELGATLLYNGFEVVYTNKDINYDMPLSSRVKYANMSKADIFVSIHANAVGNVWQTQANGIETYVYKQGGKASFLGKSIQKELITTTLLKDRGVKEGNFQVLRETTAPAVLLELGFMDNKLERQHMLDAVWHKMYAIGIARGICTYFGKVYKAYKVPQEEPITVTKAETAPKYKTEPIQYLLNEGILTDSTWLKDADKPVPLWVMATMLERIMKKGV
jgi:N-acetylmuramoyl-L-alanine amidase